MTISLGDVKRNGIRVKRLDEEEENRISPSNGQTINLGDIARGKAKINPIIDKETSNLTVQKAGAGLVPDNLLQTVSIADTEKALQSEDKKTDYQKKVEQQNTKKEQLASNTKKLQQEKEKSYTNYKQMQQKSNAENMLDNGSNRKEVERFEEMETRNKFEKKYDSSDIQKSVKKEVDYGRKTDPSTKEKLMLEAMKLHNTAQATKGISFKTVINEGEGVLDTLNDLATKATAKALSIVGRKDLAEEEKQNTRNFIARDLTNEFAEKTGLNSKLTRAVNNGSYVTEENAGGKLVQGVSQMLPRIAMSYALGVPGYAGASTKGLTGVEKASQIAKNIGTATLVNTPGNVAMGSSVYGHSLQEAYNAGATEEEATKYAIGSTATEIATEWITGGIPGTNGVGGLDIIANKGIDKISNQFAKELVKYGYKMVGEGAEEALAEIMNPILKNATYSEGEKINWKEVVESAIYGGLTSGILELPSTATNFSIINQNNKYNENLKNSISKKAVDNAINNYDLLESKRNGIENNPFAEFGKMIEQENQNKNATSNINNQNINNSPKVDINNATNDVNFSKQVDEVMNGTYPKRDMLVVSQSTPKIIQELGIKDLPITMTQKHLDTIINKQGDRKNAHYHGLGVDLVKQIPEALSRPLNVLQSDTKDNSIVVVTDLADNQERPIIASIEINGKGTIQNIRIDSNVMTSAYGRNNYDSFMKNNIAKGNLLYDIDEGIIKQKKDNMQGLQLPNDVISATSAKDRVQFPMRGSVEESFNSDIPKNISSFSADNIPQSNKSVKSSTSSTINNTQNISKNTKGLDKGSFSLLENINGQDIQFNKSKNMALVDVQQKIKNGVLKERPYALVDVKNGTPIYQKENGTKTFYLDDLQTDGIEIKNRGKVNNNDFSLMDDKTVNKLRRNGLDIKTDTIAMTQEVTNKVIEKGVNPTVIANLDTLLSEGDISSITDNKVSIEYEDGNTQYTINAVVDENGKLNIEDLTQKQMTNPERYDSLEKYKEKYLSKLSVSKDNNSNDAKILTPQTTSEEVFKEIKKDQGKSKFYDNITEKSKFISEENRNLLGKEQDIEFYDKVTNKESMNKAVERLNKGGETEFADWLRNEKRKIDSIDVAEGWVLLKRYQDAGDYDTMVQIAKRMRDMGTKSGQAVQMYNVMSRLTPEGMVKYAQSELTEIYMKYADGKSKEWIDNHREAFDLTPEETGFIVDTMKKVEKMEDGYNKKVELAKIQAMLENKLPPAKGAGVKAWMRISMLFNPKTQIRNIAGNAIIAPVNALADTFSALVDKQIAKKTGVRTTGTTNIKSYTKGYSKGIYESYNDFKQGINTRNVQGNRFEVGYGKSFNERTIIGKTLNKTDKMLSFLLDAGDRGFYEASFTNSINNQLILNNTTEVTQSMIDIATQEALSRTWQDNNNYTRFVLSARNGLNEFMSINGYGLGDVLIPFAKTPANLTKAIIDYSPVGLAKTLLVDSRKFNNSLTNGQYTAQFQHQFVQNLGKATAGSMLYILGYALAKAKITTGKSDDDKDVRDFMKNTLGIQSYSIKIGDKSYTYDWAQPVAGPFAITADLVNNTNEEATLTEKISSVADTGFNILLQQSFLSSIQDVLTDYDGLASGLNKEILDLPARAVPTFLKQINDMVDSTQRTSFEKGKPIESAKNTIKSKTPGLSKDLAVSRDSLGREIKKYGGNNNPFNVFLNPANTNKGKKSKSAEEIYEVYQDTGDKTIMPRVAPYSISLNGKNKSLTAQERSEFQKISGEIIEKNVKKLPQNSLYKKLSSEDKAVAIKGIVDYAYNKAKSEVLDTEIAKTYKTADKYQKNGGALYDFYAKRAYKNKD